LGWLCSCCTLLLSMGQLQASGQAAAEQEAPAVGQGSAAASAAAQAAPVAAGSAGGPAAAPLADMERRIRSQREQAEQFLQQAQLERLAREEQLEEASQELSAGAALMERAAAIERLSSRLARLEAEAAEAARLQVQAAQAAGLEAQAGRPFSAPPSSLAEFLAALPSHRRGDSDRAAENPAGNEARSSQAPTSQAAADREGQSAAAFFQMRAGAAEDELQEAMEAMDAPDSLEESMDVDGEDSLPEADEEDEPTTEEGESAASQIAEDEEEEQEPEQEQETGPGDDSEPAAAPAAEEDPDWLSRFVVRAAEARQARASSAMLEIADETPAPVPPGGPVVPSGNPGLAAPSAGDQDPVWSAMVTIDRDIPFDFVWQGVQNSVKTVLGNVLDTWQRAGWSNAMDMEVTLRRAVQAGGIGPVARGLKKADAERVSKMLEAVLTSSMQVDHAGAQAARAIRDASPVDDAQLRERLQARVRALQGRISGNGNDSPGLREARESLQRMDADLADDSNWRRRAQPLERHLRRLERMLSSRRTDGFDLIALLVMAAREGSGRRKVITVDRSKILASALKPVTEASPEDLRPGKVLIRYLGEEGEDGQGGGGVTRAFLSDAGGLLAEPQLGLLLPAPGGHMQLSPLPGFFALGAEDPQSMSSQSERWCRFFGRLLGMAVAHEAPIGVRLAPPLCKQLLGVDPCFEDLQFVPGLNEGGAGWYSSMRNLIGQRSFPSLAKSEASFDRLEEEVVKRSLLGLEALMPSRAQQCFESLALYIGSCVHCPSLWPGCVKVARALLQKAKTKPQRDMVLNEINKLVRGVCLRSGKVGEDHESASLSLEEDEETECSCSGALPPELLLDLKSLLALASASSRAAAPKASAELVASGAAALEQLLRPLLQEMASSHVSFHSGEGTGSQTARKRELSDLAEAGEGIPSMQPSKRVKASAAAVEDVEIVDDKDECDWETSSVVDGFEEDSGDAAELSIEKLPAFAEAVTHKALIANLQPHLDTIVKEFRSVVPKKLCTSLTWQEVQDRISGKRMDSESFVQEWRERTTYGSCEEKDAVVQLWWEFVSDQLATDLHRLFTWCTGYAAIPTTPWKFHIKVVDDTRRCPTINTCMTDDSSAANRGVKMPTIYLPAYDSKAILAQKMSWSLAGASGMSLY